MRCDNENEKVVFLFFFFRSDDIFHTNDLEKVYHMSPLNCTYS